MKCNNTIEIVLLLTVLLSIIFMRKYCVECSSGKIKYLPNWESLDSRPLPSWYDEAKFGIFIHWGVFSVPSFNSEWFWHDWKVDTDPQGYARINEFMKKNYKPGYTYADFAKDFTAEFFDPDRWTEIFKAAGAKYVVLTTKHHEGFTNWPSKHSSNWNAMSVGPKRDIVGEFSNSIRKNSDIHLGLYHSLYEWFNPLYLQDQANNFETRDFVHFKAIPELYELVNTYKPEIVWSDGDGYTYKYWNSTDFLAWLYNESPVKDTIVTNDRWGKDCRCKHGGFFTCTDRYNPGVLQKRKWENAMSIDASSWGYSRSHTLSTYLTIEELITSLVSTVSCGGNMLLNVGPTKEGHIMPIFEERLRQMGSWLSVNGDAIYGTVPWKHQNDSVTKGIWYTTKYSKHNSTQAVNAITLNWPSDVLTLGSVHPTPGTLVTLLGSEQNIQWQKSSTGGLDIITPRIPFNKMPCKWAWVFQLHYVNP